MPNEELIPLAGITVFILTLMTIFSVLVVRLCFGKSKEPEQDQIPGGDFSEVEIGAVKLRDGKTVAKDQLLSDKDMVISGEIDLLDDKEIPQGETQPIPTVDKDGKEIPPVVMDAGPKNEGAFGEGHGLFSFYRKLADPRQYPLEEIRKAIPSIPLSHRIEVGAKRFYDTVTLTPDSPTYDGEIFVSAPYQGVKTNLETNLPAAGVLLHYGEWEGFVFHTVLLEFLPRSVSQKEIDSILEGGIFRIESGMTTRRLSQVPLSDFVPLTIEKNPRVFFSTGNPNLVQVLECVKGGLSFPRGFPELTRDIKLKFSLVGIAVRRSSDKKGRR